MIKIFLLEGDRFGSLQAKREFTMNSCSIVVNFLPFLVAKLFAIDLAIKSLQLKLIFGTSLLTSEINSSKILGTFDSFTPTGIAFK